MEPISANSSALSSCKVPAACGRQGGLQVLKAGAGAAKMCCCHLSCWARESWDGAGVSLRVPLVHRETPCRCRGYLCALPQRAQAVCSGSSAALFLSPDNSHVSSGGPWHWMLLGLAPPPLFFFPHPSVTFPVVSAGSCGMSPAPAGAHLNKTGIDGERLAQPHTDREGSLVWSLTPQGEEITGGEW